MIRGFKNPRKTLYALLIGVILVSIASVPSYSNITELKITVAPQVVIQGHPLTVNILVNFLQPKNNVTVSVSILRNNSLSAIFLDKEVRVCNGSLHIVLRRTIGYDWPSGNYTLKVTINNVTVYKVFTVRTPTPLLHVTKKVVHNMLVFLSFIMTNKEDKTFMIELNKTLELYREGNYRVAYMKALNLTRMLRIYISKNPETFNKTVAIDATLERYHDILHEINKTLVSLKVHGICNTTLQIRNLSRIRTMLRNMSRTNFTNRKVKEMLVLVEKKIIKIINVSITKYSSKVEKIKILKMINKLKQKIKDEEFKKLLENIEKNITKGNCTCYHEVMKEISKISHKCQNKHAEQYKEKHHKNNHGNKHDNKNNNKPSKEHRNQQGMQKEKGENKNKGNNPGKH
ncbi:MAG TPA: hypothetical protein ENG40_02950 [Thermoprotei archaeon]|nr:MAG: hypothetical protein DRJ64_01975 [Thermoprotei archaeon]HDJ89633.1 hypothetical protein [Thermoprotei archaeon]